MKAYRAIYDYDGEELAVIAKTYIRSKFDKAAKECVMRRKGEFDKDKLKYVNGYWIDYTV